MKCRNRPIEFEAVKLIGFDNGEPVFSEEPEWLKDALGEEITVVNGGEFPKLELKTFYRRRNIVQNDFILYNGTLDSCHSFEFEMTNQPQSH